MTESNDTTRSSKGSDLTSSTTTNNAVTEEATIDVEKVDERPAHVFQSTAARFNDLAAEKRKANLNIKSNPTSTTTATTSDDDNDALFRRSSNFQAQATTSILPMPTLGRTEALPTALPGAHRYGPPSAELSMAFSVQSQANDLSASTTTMEPLAVAQRISMRGSSGQLTFASHRELQRAVAMELRDSQLSRDRRHRELTFRKWKRNYFVLAIVVLLITAIVLMAVFIPRSKSSHDDEKALDQQEDPPTLAPTSMAADAYLISLLPEPTIDLLQDVDSPQAKAFAWMLQDPALNDNQMQAPQQLRQRFALATLYYATNGEKWKDNQHWLNHSISECEWFNQEDFAAKETINQFYPGFCAEFFPPPQSRPPRCNDLGLYEHLWLDQNNLQGTIPDEIYLLTSLKTISTAMNPLVGTISTQVGQLTDLEGFFLFSSALTGTIPTQFGLLTNLRGICTYSNRLHGSFPSQLWTLENLSTISVGINDFQVSIPTEIGLFSNLRWFDMTECGLTGTIPTEFGQLSSLQWTPLFGNQLTGSIPSEIGQLDKLWVMSISSNQLNGTLPSELGLLPSLFALDLANNHLSGSLPTELGKLSNTLALSIHIGNNLFSGSIPSELGQLTLLQKMSFQDNRFTGFLPSELAFLTNMAWMEFANNDLSGTIPSELDGLQKSLHTFNLEGNPNFEGVIPGKLCAINKTCLSSTLVVSCPEKDGLTFDCGNHTALCGCDCPC